MNNDRKTKIILICTLIAAVGVLIAYVAVVLNSRREIDDTPPATSNEVVEEPTPTPTPDPDPSAKIDYSKIYNEIIPATADNGNIGDHIRGNANSKVIVLEYADLQCPGCAALMLYMSSLYKNNSDNVAFVFRHYPLQMHPNAGVAAVAAESAGLQGYFWEMTEALYSQQGTWANKSGDELRESYITIFKSIAPKGDVDKFTANLENQNLITKVTFDHDLGRLYHHVNSTPSVFVNGKEFSVLNYTTLNDFYNAVQTEINTLLKQ